MTVNVKNLTGTKIALLICKKRQWIDEKVKALDLSRTQWQVLAHLNYLPMPCAQQKLLKSLDIDRAHLARLLGQLEERGIIIRSQVPGDKRALHIELTQQGRALKEKVKEALLQEHKQMLSGFTAQEVAQLDGWLDKMTVNLLG
jgi:DNA-binding MarR family transcriptional regulator